LANRQQGPGNGEGAQLIASAVRDPVPEGALRPSLRSGRGDALRVRRWRHTDKSLEVFDKVGLVEVPEFQGQLCPVHRPAVSQRPARSFECESASVAPKCLRTPGTRNAWAASKVSTPLVYLWGHVTLGVQSEAQNPSAAGRAAPLRPQRWAEGRKPRQKVASQGTLGARPPRGSWTTPLRA
jgi:hypothetical protein